MYPTVLIGRVNVTMSPSRTLVGWWHAYYMQMYSNQICDISHITLLAFYRDPVAYHIPIATADGPSELCAGEDVEGGRRWEQGGERGSKEGKREHTLTHSPTG